MMRIISGIKRGKKLLSLEGENTRPTLERVKQAFFNAIQFEVAGRTVLDLFSGSGQLGLEALSRGAEYCFFNDASVDACKIIEKNIISCDFLKKSQLTCKSYESCVKIINNSGKKISLVFLDPPYGNGYVVDSLDLLDKYSVLEKDAIVVCESAVDDIAEHPSFDIRKQYNYSNIKVTILTYNR